MIRWVDVWRPRYKVRSEEDAEAGSRLSGVWAPSPIGVRVGHKFMGRRVVELEFVV